MIEHSSVRGGAARSLAVVAVVLGGWIVSGCSSKPSAPGQYSSGKHGFAITGPASWEMKEGQMGTAVMFLEPQQGASDDFRENVNVVVENLPAGMGLEGYVKASGEGLAKVATDYQQIESSRVKLGGQDAQRIVYRHRMGVYDLQVLSYVVAKGGRGYVLTCTATSDAFADHERAFEQVCQSFQAN